MVKKHWKRPRTHEKHKIDLLNYFRQPNEQFYRMPEMELRGGRIVADGCRRVLDYTPQRLCLDFGKSVTTFYGNNLKIELFAGKRLVIAGKIIRIEFASKWEEENGPV